MTIKPDQEAKFLETAQRGVKLVQDSEPWVLLYVLTKHADKPNTYVWLERYVDEASLAKHRAMSYMDELLARVRECLNGPPERLVLEQLLPA